MKIMLMTSVLLAASTSFAALVPVAAESTAAGLHSVTPLSLAALPQSLAARAVASEPTAVAPSDSAAPLVHPDASVAAILPDPLHGTRAEWTGLNTGLSAIQPLGAGTATLNDRLRPAVAAQPTPESAPGVFTTVRLEDTNLPLRRLDREEGDLRFAFNQQGATQRSPLEFAAYGALALGAYLGFVALRRTRRRHWRLA